MIDEGKYFTVPMMEHTTETGPATFFLMDGNGTRTPTEWDGSGNIRYHDLDHALEVGDVFTAGGYRLRVIAPAIDDYGQWPLVTLT